MSDPGQALQKAQGDGVPAEMTTREFSRKEVELLKRTIAQDATDTELSMFIQNCKRYGLDPFTGQIHAVKRWDSNAGREVMSVQVGIDGFRLIADRTGKWTGTKGPYWCDKDGQWTDVWLKDTNPAAAKVGVLRSDFSEPRWGIARWDAYVATKKGGDPTFMWCKMPAHMLAKCAEALALRSAFPNDLSGLYTDAEMDQAGDQDKRTYDGPDPDQVQNVEAEVVSNGQNHKSDQWYEDAIGWLKERDQSWSAVVEYADRIPSQDHPLKDWPDDWFEKAKEAVQGSGKETGDAPSGNGEASPQNEKAPTPMKSSVQTSGDEEDRKWASPEEAINQHFDMALEYAGVGTHKYDAISEKQLQRLYAIADEEGWDESHVDRMIKDLIGYDSKSDIPVGDAYEEVIEALQSQEMRFWMQRDPDTPDMFDGPTQDPDEVRQAAESVDVSGEDANHEAFEDPDDDLPF